MNGFYWTKTGNSLEMEKKKDRRILRTRKMLATSLLELIEEKEYTKISIKDITSRANIGRSTFYEHFEIKILWTESP